MPEKPGPALRGIIATVVTPFDEHGEIDTGRLRAEVRHLLGAEVTALCACGTTGEGNALSAQESALVCSTVVEEVADRVPVIGGIIQNSTHEVLRYGAALKAAGVAALQITPVHYLWAPTAESTVEYYAEIGAALELPIVIYNVVPWALIEPALVDRLADLPWVIGIKQSGGDLHKLADLVETVSDRISVLAAVDDLHLPAFVLGAQGALAAIPTVTPFLSTALWDAVQSGDLALARKLHGRILPIWRAIDGPNQPATIKEALRLQGRDGGLPRRPVSPVTPEVSARIAAALDGAGLLAPGVEPLR
ncbi:dihydrodipicolinate synthase family protein [Amycolatopsis jiangsuensis]|uniref:4-hydroxy-tetrahydrodipicolinate synthase n=1 Tax=Amycolatopsis jiangsuensis TaxID=1181879 RepID=A0A840IM96_9PSEU|nr:dihydrodipicolinate synthase family protein [Amycolatopsis jiangsuensis]MBB4683511.1 4-hydroxy-tetrahydrodipicolinate synthase [Amycolatopsis jiangsuensis]